jgi:sugar lactone lactonase YvrE
MYLLLAAILIAGCGTGWAQQPDKPQGTRYPLAVAVHEETIYVADLKLPGVWRLQDGTASIYFQAEKKFRTPLNAIRCLAIDSEGRLLAGDSSTRNIYRFDKQGKPSPIIDSPVGIGLPMAIVVDSAGDLLVADLETHRVIRVTAKDGTMTPVARVQAPRGLAIDGENKLLVLSHGPDQVVHITSEGAVEKVVEGRPFKFPHHIALNDQGVLYVADGYGKCIWKVKDGAAEKWVADSAFANPVGVAWLGDSLLVADPQANRLFELTRDGEVSVRIPVAR